MGVWDNEEEDFFVCKREKERKAHADEQIFKTTDHEERICP